MCGSDTIPKPSNYSIIVKNKRVPFENGVIYWSVNNYSRDADKLVQLTIFHDIMQEYERRLWPLRVQKTDDPKKAYIKISFANKNVVHMPDGSKWNVPVKFQEGVLAYAFGPYDDYWAGHVIVNDDFFWETKNEDNGNFKVRNTLDHEVGHVFNLGHTDVETDLMYPEYGEHRKWTKDSQRGLEFIYGVLMRHFFEKLGYVKRYCQTKAKQHSQKADGQKSWWARQWQYIKRSFKAWPKE